MQKLSMLLAPCHLYIQHSVLKNSKWYTAINGATLLKRMYELVRQIWEAERIPEEWKETIIVPIHKRGDRDRRENYREIALGNAAYKILSNILEKLNHILKKLWGTIRMDSEMEDLQLTTYMH